MNSNFCDGEPSDHDAVTDWSSMPLGAWETVARMLAVDAADLVRLSLSCSALRSVGENPELWLDLTARRFGRESLPTDLPADDGTSARQQAVKQLYCKLARKKLSIAADGGATWLNGTYLSREVVSGSESSEVVRLKSVCWLDVYATFKGVPSGKYTLRWRLGLSLYWQPSFSINLLADAGNSRDTLSDTSAASDGQDGSSSSHKAAISSPALQPLPHVAEQGQGLPLISKPNSMDPNPGPLIMNGAAWTALGHKHGPGWFWLEVGTVELHGPPTTVHDVHVKMWNYDDPQWKSGVLFDCVELVPLPAE